MIKCIGCPQLKRKTVTRKGLNLVVYDCPEFPHMCALSGLLRPSKRIGKAAEQCGFDMSLCVVCGGKAVHSYGIPPVAWACSEHDKAWGTWLDKHPDRRQHFSTHNRLHSQAWVEVFREFVEASRPVGG